MFRIPSVARASARLRTTGLAALAMALVAAGTPAGMALAQSAEGMTHQQAVDALRGKPSRSFKPGQPAASEPEPAPPAAATRAATERLSGLLERGRTRAFTAKERMEVAEAVRERPSLDFEIYFPFNSSSLQKSAMATMQRLGEILGDPALRDRGFLIAGHTDAKGSPEANQIVSQRRAEAVKAYLAKTFGIDAGRLHVIGYGKEQLKDTGQPFASINRRVQVINLPDGMLTASR